MHFPSSLNFFRPARLLSVIKENPVSRISITALLSPFSRKYRYSKRLVGEPSVDQTSTTSWFSRVRVLFLPGFSLLRYCWPELPPSPSLFHYPFSHVPHQFRRQSPTPPQMIKFPCGSMGQFQPQRCGKVLRVKWNYVGVLPFAKGKVRLLCLPVSPIAHSLVRMPRRFNSFVQKQIKSVFPVISYSFFFVEKNVSI